jgi:hypothetical protein
MYASHGAKACAKGNLLPAHAILQKAILRKICATE